VRILRRVRRTVPFAAILLGAAIPTAARATASARLVYSRSSGADSCASETALRAAVAERVGYDPFFPGAKPVVVASMGRAGEAGFVARIRMIDEHGIEYGTREYRAEDDVLRKGLNIDARVSFGGKVRYYNRNSYVVTLGNAADAHRISVNPVGP